ncbi:antibiotic biosynthesis monooxygenase [Marinobacterium nitratireducens]|uniref:Antibiotic biosynthesis monooxygenase n=1 Tax=Marinobacterium nitratireducens TaxID=518897 RepID=A0A917ZP32_9GAMM|nr:antibiotic biosynthesis monooxygenase [Marinobacterium nitratireducens]GGO88441.1 antibiotic biosynthesis monooxygenase [Marinobacterium nitratireducens]
MDPKYQEPTPKLNATEAAENAITVVISRRIKKGKEKDFEQLNAALSREALQFPGFLGTTLFRPASSDDPEYRIIFKFRTREDFERWQHSAERHQYLDDIEQCLDAPDSTEVLSGLVAWFSLPGQNPVQPPPKYKMAVVAWLAIFPLITLITWGLGPWLGHLPLIPRTLGMTVVITLLMTYVLMPLLTRLLAFWLFPKQDRGER